MIQIGINISVKGSAIPGIPPPAPVNTVLPVISGTTTLGSVLTTTNGTWINPTPAFTYQWKRNATNIGTNTPSYTLVLADSGAAITCVVTAINGGGSASATSNIITADNYAFISTFRTTTASETVTLPYEVAGTYSGTIDWGDGGPTSVNSYANRDHVYAVAGDYVITVTGVTTGFRFNNTGDRTKIRSIQNWGALRLGNNGNYFHGCFFLTLTAVNGVLDTTGTTNFASMFRQCNSLTTINNINSWNTSAVTNMFEMFMNTALNQPITFNTGAVTNMGAMFSGATAFNQPLAFNTSAVTNMKSMFQSTTVFNSSLTFNTSAVTDMSQMFFSAPSFNQPLAFNTSSVTTMQNMFQQASAFNQPLNWNTSAVTTMGSMFLLATSFNSLLTFNTSAVTNMGGMFYQATSFNQPLTFNTSSVTTMANMFELATSFNQPLTFNTSAVTTMFRMFADATSFNSSLTFNTGAVTTMSQMFNNAKAFNQPLIFNTSAVTNMNGVFQQSTASVPSAFNQPLNWDTSAVTGMSGMFGNTTSFNQPLTFNTSAVTNMASMFAGSTVFNQPLIQGVNGWNTSSVTNMGQMFQNATSFNQNIGSWNVANVTNFTNFMFGKTDLTFSTTNLDAIYNGWVTVQSGRTITFGTAKYSAAGVAGRNYLTGTKLWTITDGGL